jgi:type IV secretory pathway component VirB8
MVDFNPEQLRRWDAWRHANAISMRRNDRIARVFGLMMLAATVMAVVVAMLR